jgi:8-hydroxy-5-deazaflavin:NADPH oxidoreductase
MFICGNDVGAKKTVVAICDQFGWDAEDMGAIEPLFMLWRLPGVGKGDWSPHAFKLLR